ncbi:MAG TPA: DUF2510 domain-containing protein [Pseudolysinimonas sp.]|nr:DUF2510 domain-containing protein [Pseudolysinimonas sp.]
MTMTIDEAPTAGWYPDPLDDNSWRWWDGHTWSQQVQPRTVTPPVIRRSVVQPAPPGVSHVESAAPAPQYAPPAAPVPASQPVAAAQPAAQPVMAPAIAEPVVISEPVQAQPVVVAPPVASPPPAPVVAAPVVAQSVVTPAEPAPATPTAPSNELVIFDAAAVENQHPWEAAIAALEAEQRASTSRSQPMRSVATLSPEKGGSRRPFRRGRRTR